MADIIDKSAVAPKSAFRPSSRQNPEWSVVCVSRFEYLFRFSLDFWMSLDKQKTKLFILPFLSIFLYLTGSKLYRVREICHIYPAGNYILYVI